MALDVLFPEDIQRAIVSGVVLAVQADQGRSVEFLRGILALAAHQARTFGVSFAVVLQEARADLGADSLALLDMVQALPSVARAT